MLALEWLALGRPVERKAEYRSLFGSSFQDENDFITRLMDLNVEQPELIEFAASISSGGQHNELEISWIPYCLKGLRRIPAVQEIVVDLARRHKANDPDMINYVKLEYFWDDPKNPLIYGL